MRSPGAPTTYTFIKLSWLSIATGLLVMTAMFVWSFHLENDFTGSHDGGALQRQFWLVFFFGIFLYVMGCLAIGTIIKAQNAMVSGVGVTLTGVVLFQVIMPRVNFEGWTGGSAYMLTIMVSSGGLLMLTAGGMRYMWHKVRSSHTRAPN